jgi:L-threonylcarbamoyladenylate synthase
MKTEILSANDPNAIPRAAAVLESGGLVAFPTDTVYGLAGATFSAASIEKIFSAKERDAAKAIAVLVGNTTDLPRITAGLTEAANRLANRFWPGALTLIVPKHPNLPAVISPYPSVGVRMPNHAFALSLLRRTGPLATTSANRSGGANASTPAEVLEQLEGRVDLLINGGACPGGVPSSVVDCTVDPPGILRAGAISAAAIQAALAE